MVALFGVPSIPLLVDTATHFYSSLRNEIRIKNPLFYNFAQLISVFFIFVSCQILSIVYIVYKKYFVYK